MKGGILRQGTEVMGRMFDASEKLSSRLLKPKAQEASRSRSGPVSYNTGDSRSESQWQGYFSRSQGFEKPKIGKNRKKTQEHRHQHQHRFWGLSFFQHRAFNCLFSIHIHCIRNLPIYATHGILLEVHFVRKAQSSKTLASRAMNGSVEFEETLHLHSKIRASKSLPHTIKHPVSKSFRLLIVSTLDQAVLGELFLDLGSVLPDAIAKAPDFAASSAWTAAFKISASESLKGASVVASIGYEFLSFRNDGGAKNDQTSDSSVRSESCRFTSEPRPAFWKRIRPLSGLINVSSAFFTRSDSLKSMPDLTGLAQEVCTSCSENEGGEDHCDDHDLRTAPDSHLDSMLCSLVQAQIQSYSEASKRSEKSERKQSFQEPVELSKEEFSMDESTGSEEEVDFTAETGGGGPNRELVVAKSNAYAEDKSSVETEKTDATIKDTSSNIYDEANTVARQFLKMLENGEHSDSQQALEPLGSPVYEGNWILAPIPEEEDEADASSRYIPIAGPIPQLQLPPPCPEPEVNSVDFQAFVPTWKKEGDLNLACVMKAAEFELHRATTHVMKTRAGLVEDLNTEALMRRWGLGDRVRSSGNLGASRSDNTPRTREFRSSTSQSG